MQLQEVMVLRNPSGAMNVFEVLGQRAGYAWYSAWGLADLQAITSDNRTFELLPNTNTWNNTYWVNADGTANKSMEANTIWERFIQPV